MQRSLQDLEEEIATLSATIAAATFRLLCLLGELDRRGGWADPLDSNGFRSCAHWMTWRTGHSLGVARQYVRVARLLPELLLVSEAFGRGEVSWSKVRAIARIATPDTEEALLEVARCCTASQVEKLVRKHRRADALVRVAERALDADATGAADTDRYQVVVHVDAEVLADPAADGRCELEEGPALAAQAVQRLACDSALGAMVHGPDGELTAGRKTRAVSTALRRALRARDGTRCAFPGCGCRGRDAHHVKSWAELGPTVLPNLVQLCRRHHTFVHEGGFRVEAMPGRRFRFLRPDGRELAPAPALPAITGDAGAMLVERWVPPEVTITRDTGYPEWDGDPLDYDWALWCLAPSGAQP